MYTYFHSWQSQFDWQTVVTSNLKLSEKRTMNMFLANFQVNPFLAHFPNAKQTSNTLPSI